MPLRAFVDGEEVVAPLLDDASWQTLNDATKKRHCVVTLPCCDSLAFLRTSKLGIRHFVHQRRSACGWGPETAEHLATKAMIAKICSMAGYKVSTEAGGEGWRADVLATRGRAKLAFEVQWSRQTLAETQERQKRYEQAGVRGCWFFRRVPRDYTACHELPLFLLDWQNGVASVSIPNALEGRHTTISLSAFMTALLLGKIKFSPELVLRPSQHVRLAFFYVRCWRCKERSYIYYIDKPFVSACGVELQEHWLSAELIFQGEIIALAQRFLATEEGRRLKMGSIKPRYSKTVEHSYISFGCAYCDALFGDFFVQEDTFLARSGRFHPTAVVEETIALRSRVAVTYPHWCYSDDGVCCK
jgi:hypothetical protein